MKITEKYINTGNKDTRSGFGAGLLEVGRENSDVMALCADLTGSLKMEAFAAEFPERFIQCGIAEANMIGTSAGLALSGKIPYAGTFAGFATGRVYDQVRQSVAYSETNVKICASHAGITLGEDGATHQIMEDIGLMRMLPNLVVINPCDYNQTKAATIEIANHHGPVYLRFGRPSVPNFTPADAKFEIGKAITLAQGSDVTIFATGHLVWEAIVAAGMLEEEGISVELINIHTIKPLDKKAVLESAAKTGAVVTAEEHLIAGGMGELIAAFLATELPTPTEFVAVDDIFGQSGEPAELLKEYKLSSINIADAVKRVIAKKRALLK
ncbi:MAG: transketolase C-terminal domain-containing protein [Bacteroidales bacterium]|nr:transketolase C-terminal domain-containing protein [Bacteroidales bacterium]